MSLPERDRSVAVIAFGTALGLLSAHIAGKAIRDALFLSNFPVTDLPVVMIAAAVVSLAAAWAMSRLLPQLGPSRVVPVVFALSGFLFASEWWLLEAAPRSVAVVLYLHYAALGGVLISGFWSVINECFDPHSGKRTIARISGFATLGGVVGGLGAERVSAIFGLPMVLPALAALHLGCAVAVRAIAAGSPGQTSAAEPDALRRSSGLRTLFTQPLLLQMAGVVAALALIDGLLGYALKAEASSRFEGGEGLIRFFAIFHTAAGLVAFTLQASLGERVLKSLGLGGAMALLPGAILLTGLIGTVYARLTTAALAAGSAFALTNSFFRSGFELLYTPIPPEVKRPTKAYVDVGAQRLGDIASGGLILLLLAALPAVPTSAVLGLAALGSLGALALVLRLNKGYVSQLADSLRSGALSLSESEAEDSTTARTIHQTHLTIDRAELLARIRELQQQGDDSGGATGVEAPDPASAGQGAGAVPGPPPQHVREFIDAVGALRSGRPGLARAALDRVGDEVALVPHVLSLLEGYDLLDPARSVQAGRPQSGSASGPAARLRAGGARASCRRHDVGTPGTTPRGSRERVGAARRGAALTCQSERRSRVHVVEPRAWRGADGLCGEGHLSRRRPHSRHRPRISGDDTPRDTSPRALAQDPWGRANPPEPR